MSSSSGLLSISSYESVCILICFNFNFVFFDGVFIKISLPLSFQFLSTSRVFQIVLGDGGISHWRGRGKGNGKFYSGGGGGGVRNFLSGGGNLKRSDFDHLNLFH